MPQFSLSKAFPMQNLLSQSISPWKRTEESTTCDDHQSHHLTQSQIARAYCEELLHINISRAELEDIWWLQQWLTIDVFRKAPLGHVSYHTDTMACKILRVLQGILWRWEGTFLVFYHPPIAQDKSAEFSEY